MTGTNTRRKPNQMFKRLPKGTNGGIQLLLIHNVEHLGKQGDLVEVKAGYALNYLLPQGLATVATEHHRRMVEKHREKLRAIELEKLSEYRVLADELGKQSITIEANANDEEDWRRRGRIDFAKCPIIQPMIPPVAEVVARSSQAGNAIGN